MSQVIQYIRGLFNLPHNNSRKRRGNEVFVDEPQFPKYRRVSNIFPKIYNNRIDDEGDFFEEVKQNAPLYNDILESFVMDQQQRHFKAILDDGEFSDDDENSHRTPVTQRKVPRDTGYKFPSVYNVAQPSTSSNFNFSKRNSELSKKDEVVQFSSVSNRQAQRLRPEMPSLIPITRNCDPFVLNGNAMDSISKKTLASQQPRGRRSVLDFTRKNRAFNDSPTSTYNSIINRNNHLDLKNNYDNLLKKLIPRFASNALQFKSGPSKLDAKPVATIDLSDDDAPEKNRASLSQSSLLNRKSDSIFKKPVAYVDLSDDDLDQAAFNRKSILSSTCVSKSTRNEKESNAVDSSVFEQLSPINSLKEKQSTRKSLQEDAIKNIIKKFHDSRLLKDKQILEVQKNATDLQNERILFEKGTQKRIDDSIASTLSEKCIIIDEEEEVVDEFPPLTEEQNKLVNYVLHSARNEIIEKFNMTITRRDLMTLEGLNWLNDEVINFYMELIKERSEQLDHLPKVHVMNTFFLGKLLQNGHSGVRRWTRKVDIFSFDIIPVPVHVGGVHWCMSIIHFKNKTIKYYDSMGHPNHVVLDALEQYLKDESMDKKKVPFDTSDWTIECVRDCPQQKNGSDCGVFSCQFAEFISRDSSISFEQQHMPYFRRKMICEIATGKLLLGN